MSSAKGEESFVKIELLKHLNARLAFMPIADVLEQIPYAQLGKRPYNLPYSFYEVFYHVVYAQKDLLNFMMAEAYSLPQWPEDYWPDERQPKNEKAWETLKTTYHEDCKQFEKLMTTETSMLSRPVKHATKAEQTLLREALLLITHTAYHNGQLLIILRLLGLYK